MSLAPALVVVVVVVDDDTEAAVTEATRGEGAVAAEAVPEAETGNIPSSLRCPFHKIRVVARVSKNRTWWFVAGISRSLSGLAPF